MSGIGLRSEDRRLYYDYLGRAWHGEAWRGEAGHVADAPMYDVSFVGGAVESHTWSYLFRTRGRLHQFSALPPNVQVQIPVGQGMLLVPGLPREHRFEILSQAWEHNTMPQGVTK